MQASFLNKDMVHVRRMFPPSMALLLLCLLPTSLRAEDLSLFSISSSPGNGAYAGHSLVESTAISALSDPAIAPDLFPTDEAPAPSFISAAPAESETCSTVNLFSPDSAFSDGPAGFIDGAGKSDTDKKKWYEKLSLRGYAQFRLNEVVHLANGSAPPNYAGDSSIDDERNFLVRRARLVVSGDVHKRVYVYLQADFASSVPGSTDAEYFAQMRDWYADLYMTEDKVHRFRVGQSKVPYGWENMQSSQNRVPLDRADGLNSAVRNERDLGIFYYYTPDWVQDVFKQVLDENLKGSGNYGMFALGVYNGQGGSLRERNDNLHFVSRLTYPITFSNGQIVELGVQGYIGRYVVIGSPIEPLGVGPPIIPSGTEQNGAGDGQMDKRIAGSFIMYPQPWGFQSEWNVGRGPGLNDAQTAVEDRPLYGGYAMLLYKYDSPSWGTFFPFARYVHYKGGFKSYRNAPYSLVQDWDFGCEWQMNKAAELTVSYLFADRTNLTTMSTGESYRQFDGDVLRFQLQVNY